MLTRLPLSPAGWNLRNQSREKLTLPKADALSDTFPGVYRTTIRPEAVQPSAERWLASPGTTSSVRGSADAPDS